MKKSGTPRTINTADWLIYKLIDCVMCYLYMYGMCTCVSWVPGRVASWLKAPTGKIRVPVQSNLTQPHSKDKCQLIIQCHICRCLIAHTSTQQLGSFATHAEEGTSSQWLNPNWDPEGFPASPGAGSSPIWAPRWECTFLMEESVLCISGLHLCTVWWHSALLQGVRACVHACLSRNTCRIISNIGAAPAKAPPRA